MGWKSEIKEHYRKKKIKEQGYTREQIDRFYVDTVMPAFDEIKATLSQFVSKVNGKRYAYKATLRFDEKEIRKSVFRVEVDLKGNGVAFPYELNNSYTFGARVKVDQLEALDKEFIIAHFMEFFKVREQKIAEQRPSAERT
ncbi:hypothetical protein EKG40_08285 [Pseudomonas moorei]|nr:hypothetical protein EKG40_08285 [Pseudomonas moorei]